MLWLQRVRATSRKRYIHVDAIRTGHRKIYILIKYGEWHLINLHNSVVPTAAASFHHVPWPPPSANSTLRATTIHCPSLSPHLNGNFSTTRTHTHRKVVRSIVKCNAIDTQKMLRQIRAHSLTRTASRRKPFARWQILDEYLLCQICMVLQRKWRIFRQRLGAKNLQLNVSSLKIDTDCVIAHHRVFHLHLRHGSLSLSCSIRVPRNNTTSKCKTNSRPPPHFWLSKIIIIIFR